MLFVALSRRIMPMALCEPVDLERTRSFGQIAKIEPSFPSHSVAFFLAGACGVERRQILNRDREDREAFTEINQRMRI